MAERTGLRVIRSGFTVHKNGRTIPWLSDLHLRIFTSRVSVPAQEMRPLGPLCILLGRALIACQVRGLRRIVDGIPVDLVFFFLPLILLVLVLLATASLPLGLVVHVELFVLILVHIVHNILICQTSTDRRLLRRAT
jgi:hypothetical protein